MRRATAAVMPAMLVIACSTAVAQPSDDDWPTPAELRQELADDGWDWAASSFLWSGGRGGPVVHLGITPPLFVSVTIDDLWGFGLMTWEEQTQMSLTAFMELAERLPIDTDTLEAALDQVGEPGCRDLPIEGGMVTLRGTTPYDDREGAPFQTDVTIRQGGEARCDVTMIEEVLSDSNESPAA